jgi:hypothetical protein
MDILKHLRGIWASWCWALDQSRRSQFEQAVFGKIDPSTITDIDKFLRSRGVLW